MIELSVIFGLYVVASSALIFYLVKSGKEERSELEDRVMALAKPDSIIVHKALRDQEPGSVDYVDEAKEYELGSGDLVFVGDDD